MNQDELIPYEKVYKSGKTMKIIDKKLYDKKLKINANKVMFCCKFPESRGMILAVLLTCHLKQKFDCTVCTFSHLEGFMSNEN